MCGRGGGGLEVQHEDEDRRDLFSGLSEVLCDNDYKWCLFKTHKKYKEVLREVYFDNKKKRKL